MPDLLPKRTTSSSPSPTPAPQTPAQGARVSARPGDPQKLSVDYEKELAAEVKKAPSKFWTEYFGAAFLFLVAIFILVAFFVLQPLIIQYKKITGSIGAVAQHLSDNQAYLESLRHSIAAAQSISPEALASIDEALPHEGGIPKLLTMVALIAQQHHIALNSISFSPSPGGGLDGSDTVDIDISVSTLGYVKTRELLEALEYNLRLFDIDTITISAGAAATQSQNQSIRIRTYNLPPPVAGL